MKKGRRNVAAVIEDLLISSICQKFPTLLLNLIPSKCSRRLKRKHFSAPIMRKKYCQNQTKSGKSPTAIIVATTTMAVVLAAASFQCYATVAVAQNEEQKQHAGKDTGNHRQQHSVSHHNHEKTAAVSVDDREQEGDHGSHVAVSSRSAEGGSSNEQPRQLRHGDKRVPDSKQSSKESAEAVAPKKNAKKISPPSSNSHRTRTVDTPLHAIVEPSHPNLKPAKKMRPATTATSSSSAESSQSQKQKVVDAKNNAAARNVTISHSLLQQHKRPSSSSKRGHLARAHYGWRELTSYEHRYFCFGREGFTETKNPGKNPRSGTL